MSRAPTVLLPGVALKEAELVSVDGDVYRHFFRARRLTVGETVRVADGDGAARFGAIESVNSSSAALRLGDPAPSGEATMRVTVVAAALRPERARIMVEKATELGAFEFLFFSSERTPRQLRDGGLRRLGRVAESAVAQCGRSRVPAIGQLDSWAEVVDRVRVNQAAYLLDLTSRDETPVGHAGRIGEQLAAGAVPAPLLLLGPEGGLTETERCELCDAGAEAIWLGPRTLRAETAAIVGCALLLGSGLD